MQAGIGGILTALDHGHAHDVIGAVVFASRASVAGRDKTWMRWGTMLALHGDLNNETWSQWMDGGRREDERTVQVGDRVYPAWISFDALRAETHDRMWSEARRRHDAVQQARYVREYRSLLSESGKIGKGRIGRKILQRANEDYKIAEDEQWPEIKGNILSRCATSVLQEFRVDTRCKHCGGTGVTPYILDLGREVPCAACYGTGVTRASDRDRSKSIDVAWSTYKRAWKRPYDWLYQEALTARRQAVRHLREQLNEV